MESGTLFSISYALLWVVVFAQAVLLLAVARLVGRLHRRVGPVGARMIEPGPEIGEAVEGWSGQDLFGNLVEFPFGGERGLLLVYISPHCSVCAGLVPSARRFFEEIEGGADAAWVMVKGVPDSQRKYARERGLDERPVLAEPDLPPSWRVEGSPFAVWFDAAGQVVAKGLVNNREHLESLRYAAESEHSTLEDLMQEVGEEHESLRDAS